MKILIVSDTHRKDANLERALEAERPIGRLIHLGDSEESEGAVQKIAGCPVDIVSGNNDYFSDFPREKEIWLGGSKILLTHGHYYYVSLDSRVLASEAQARGFDIVMYGHTHRPKLEQKGSVLLVNPGSLSYPRQEGRKPSYIVMELEEGQKPNFSIRYLE